MAKTMVKKATKSATKTAKAAKKVAKKAATKTAKKAATTAKAAKKASKAKETSKETWQREDILVHIDSLVPSSLNPRHIAPPAERIRELADSIKKVGVLDRLIVRRVPDTFSFEVLAGSSRRLAIELAVSEGADPMVPVTVLDVPDDVALELAITSNDQRHDPHPLDQCAAFARLRDEFGRTIPQIAAKIGRTPHYVYDRLRLEALGPVARQALIDGRISTTVAQLLARCASPRAQEQATTELLQRWRDEPVPVSAARSVVRYRLMVIADAPFPTADASYPGGSCEGCERRTDAERQQLAFGDLLVEGEDAEDARCLDLDCWDAKAEHLWERIAEQARAEGKHVATPEEQSAISPRTYGPLAGGYVHLDHYADNGREGTWREQLGERIAEVDITVLRDGARAVEVARRAQIVEIIDPYADESDRDEEGRTERTPRSEGADVVPNIWRASLAERRLMVERIMSEDGPLTVADVIRFLAVFAVETIAGDILDSLGGTTDADDKESLSDEARRLALNMNARQALAMIADQLSQDSDEATRSDFLAALGIKGDEQ